MPTTWSVPPRVLADAVDLRELVRLGQVNGLLEGKADTGHTHGLPAHAATHATGGSDALAPADIGAVSTAQRAPIGGSSSSTLSVTQTYTIDASGAPVRYFTLTANPTLAVPSGGVNGQRMVFWLLASGANRTFTFASGYEVSPMVPSRAISVASGSWEKIEAECRNGTWRLVDPDQLLFSPADIGALAPGDAVPAGGPVANLYATASQSVANNTWTMVAFAGEQVDTADGHTGSASRWTCPTGWAGYYLLNGLVYFGTYSGGIRAGVFYKNGTQVPGSIVRTNAITDSGGYGMPMPSVPVYLAAGDYVELAGLHSNGAAQAAGFYASGAFASFLGVTFQRR